MPFPNVCGKRKKNVFFAARVNTLRETRAFHVIKDDEQEGENHGREAAAMMWPQLQKSTVDLSTPVQPSDIVMMLCQPQSSQLRVKQNKTKTKQKDNRETSCVKYVYDSVFGYMQPYNYKMDMPTLEVTCL